jgi:hypothetical protein
MRTENQIEDSSTKVISRRGFLRAAPGIFLVMATLFVGRLVDITSAQAQSITGVPDESAVTNAEASPVFGVKVPAGYRQWGLIAPLREAGQAGSPDRLYAILGNDIAMKAYQEGTLPFPDGTILIKRSWEQVPSTLDDDVLGGSQAFIPGRAAMIQVMIKDSKKYASTGGWGFGKWFMNGKPVSKAQHEACFECHESTEDVKNHDFVFTRYAP